MKRFYSIITGLLVISIIIITPLAYSQEQAKWRIDRDNDLTVLEITLEQIIEMEKEGQPEVLHFLETGQATLVILQDSQSLNDYKRAHLKFQEFIDSLPQENPAEEIEIWINDTQKWINDIKEFQTEQVQKQLSEIYSVLNNKLLSISTADIDKIYSDLLYLEKQIWNLNLQASFDDHKENLNIWLEQTADWIIKYSQYKPEIIQFLPELQFKQRELQEIDNLESLTIFEKEFSNWEKTIPYPTPEENFNQWVQKTRKWIQALPHTTENKAIQKLVTNLNIIAGNNNLNQLIIIQDQALNIFQTIPFNELYASTSSWVTHTSTWLNNQTTDVSKFLKQNQIFQEQLSQISEYQSLITFIQEFADFEKTIPLSLSKTDLLSWINDTNNWIEKIYSSEKNQVLENFQTNLTHYTEILNIINEDDQQDLYLIYEQLISLNDELSDLIPDPNTKELSADINNWISHIDDFLVKNSKLADLQDKLKIIKNEQKNLPPKEIYQKLIALESEIKVRLQP